MQKYIICLLLCFINFQLNSQFLTHQYEFEKVRKERINLKKNKIFKINEYTSDKLVKSIKELQQTKSTELDENGFKIKETMFDPEYENIIFNYFYTTDGKLFKTVLANYDVFDLLSTYKYDSTGKLTEEFHGGGENRKYEIKYDNQGRIIEKIGYTGTLPIDEEGNVLENAEPVWDFIDKYIYEYNNKGELIVEYFYYLDMLSYTNFFYYDKTGKRTKWINRLGDNYDIIYLYNFDKKGLLQYITVKDPNETRYLIYDYEFFK